jgi:hypothetical protein
MSYKGSFIIKIMLITVYGISIYKYRVVLKPVVMWTFKYKAMLHSTYAHSINVYACKYVHIEGYIMKLGLHHKYTGI